VESVKAGALILYSPKLYVKGDLTLSERDAAELAEKEAIIVKGRANLPPVCIKAFRRIGKAASYRVLDRAAREINGIEEFTHAQLQTIVKRGEKISLTVNGSLRFTDDVTPEDMDCIESLSYNGMVQISAEARGALASRIGGANGFMGDLASLQEFARGLGGQVPFLDHQLLMYTDDEDSDADVTRINAGVFVL
jgi:ribosomal protein S11